MTDPTQAEATADRKRLSHHEQMLDAQAGCVPCKLCGGNAVISDAGIGAGYYVQCSNSFNFRDSTGCLINNRRLGGWAYNVMDWWNRLHATPPASASVADEARERKRAMAIIAKSWADRGFPDSAEQIAEQDVWVVDAMLAFAARPAGEGERPSDDDLDPHLPEHVGSEKRCGIQRSAWLDGWYVPWSPRNDNESAEGPWSHWVALANEIIAVDQRARAALATEGTPS
jgi:hypothetical protein